MPLNTKFSKKAGVAGGVRKVGSWTRADDEYLVVRGNRPPLILCDSATTGVLGVGGAADPAVIGDRFL